MTTIRVLYGGGTHGNKSIAGDVVKRPGFVQHHQDCVCRFLFLVVQLQQRKACCSHYPLVNTKAKKSNVPLILGPRKLSYKIYDLVRKQEPCGEPGSPGNVLRKKANRSGWKGRSSSSSKMSNGTFMTLPGYTLCPLFITL